MKTLTLTLRKREWRVRWKEYIEIKGKIKFKKKAIPKVKGCMSFSTHTSPIFKTILFINIEPLVPVKKYDSRIFIHLSLRNLAEYFFGKLYFSGQIIFHDFYVFSWQNSITFLKEFKKYMSISIGLYKCSINNPVIPNFVHRGREN